jgi:hypothetical protein
MKCTTTKTTKNKMISVLLMNILGFAGSVMISCLATSQAHAFSNLSGMGTASPVSQHGNVNSNSTRVSLQDPQPLEELMGRQLTNEELSGIEEMIGEVQKIREMPQTVSTFGSVEVIPLVCGQFKVNFQILTKALGGEIETCVDFQTGKSYILSGAAIGGASSISATVRVGIYVGPSAVQTPIIGQYAFGNISKEVFPSIYAHGQLSVGKGCLDSAVDLATQGRSIKSALKSCQLLVFGGVGVNLDGLMKNTYQKFFGKKSTEVSGTPMSVDAAKDAVSKLTGFSLTTGVIFNIKEFPWYDRMRNKGMGVVQAFADIKTYQAPVSR